MTQAMADCVHLPCGNCGAKAGDWCTFTVDGKTFQHHGPCVERLRAAEKAATA